MLEVTFGTDRFAIADQDELPILMRSQPGRLLQVHHHTRVAWFLFYADKGGQIHCGFRKSTSSTFHFFKVPDLEEPQTFREFLMKLGFSDSLKYRKKKKSQTKGEGGKKNGICIYLGKEYDTVSHRVQCKMVEKKHSYPKDLRV